MSRYRHMLTTFDVTVSGSHATAHLEIRRSPSAPSHRYLGAVLLTLIALPVVLLASAALSSVTGHAGFDLLTHVAVIPPVAVALVLVCPLIAVVVPAAVRLRVTVERSEGAWHGRIRVELTKGELAAAVLGLSLIAVFVGHLVADGYACLNGIRRAC
jgi:hypothetical protein